MFGDRKCLHIGFSQSEKSAFFKLTGQHLKPNRQVVLPTKDGAAVVTLSPEASLTYTIPFEGKLRASRILDDHIIFINEKGRIFRSEKPRKSESS